MPHTVTILESVYHLPPRFFAENVLIICNIVSSSKVLMDTDAEAGIKICLESRNLEEPCYGPNIIIIILTCI